MSKHTQATDDLVWREKDHGATRSITASPPRRALEAVHLQPGFSIYLGKMSYSSTTLHVDVHKRLRMWDVGDYCLLQAVDHDGKVIDEVELMWQAVYWRKAAKPGPAGGGQ